MLRKDFCIECHRVDFGEAFVYCYFFGNLSCSSETSSLAILLVGSGTDCVLSDSMMFPKYFVNYFPSGFDFLIPDKINIQISLHNNLLSVLRYYTLEYRIFSTTKAIDIFIKNISRKKYKQIQFWGVSEGGKILPRVFAEIGAKYNITKLVLWASGGMSQYEEFYILKNSGLILDQAYREELNKLEEIKLDIYKNPYSLDKVYLGWPYRRWSSFLDYQPIQDMKNISIPILCIHGIDDVNCPVESSRYIQKTFKDWAKNNVICWEFANMDHYNMNFEEIIYKAAIM